jgi:citrate lyase gamma subunit
MNNRPQHKLHQELRTAGASADETRELMLVANKLRTLQAAKPPRHSLWVRFAPFAATAFAFLLIGTSTVTFAQSSLPGDWLYPVKRLSENAAVAVDSNYRATLMMRRAEEVNQLVGKHASTQTILATLADYKVQAVTYKTKDYAAFSYCKSALQQAAAKATPHEQQMIASTLSSLRDID